MAMLISNKVIEPFVFEENELKLMKVFLVEQKNTLLQLEKIVSKFILVKDK